MSDPDAGKYNKLFKQQFAIATETLAQRDGQLEWVRHDYQAFIYREPGVCLVFYPHKTSGTGNRHIRVRDQGSKDKKLAKELMESLDRAAGFNCTFTRKH